MTTKENIIYQSLKLFSKNGYESVSTRMIARAAGMSDTAIYKHFKSKQEILDTIIQVCKERFVNKRMEVDVKHICWDQVEDICMDMFRFQTEDEWIVMFRQLLVVEQFKNQEMAILYRSFFIDIAVNGMAEMFAWLIEEGYMVERDPKVMAMELYAPFFMFHTLGHQEPDNLLTELRKHIQYFREDVRTEKG